MLQSFHLEINTVLPRNSYCYYKRDLEHKNLNVLLLTCYMNCTLQGKVVEDVSVYMVPRQLMKMSK